MSQLRDEVLAVVQLIDSRPSVKVELVAEKLRGVLASGAWGELDSLHRGAAFGACSLAPVAGEWGDLPVESRASLVAKLKDWLVFASKSQ